MVPISIHAFVFGAKSKDSYRIAFNLIAKSTIKQHTHASKKKKSNLK